MTTPSCLTSAGEWRLENRKIVVHFTSYLDVDHWEHEDEHVEFTVVKFNGDAMQLHDPEEKRVVSYKRLFPEYTVPAFTCAFIDRDLFGIWRVHYNTHDYEIELGQDHSFGVFANLPDWQRPQKGGTRQQLWTGTWRIANGKLLTDAKTVPSFEGELIETQRRGWSITGVETGRIAVRDGPVRYIWQRRN